MSLKMSKNVSIGNIDDEWTNFLTNKCDDTSSDDQSTIHYKLSDDEHEIINDEIEKASEYSDTYSETFNYTMSVPEPTDIYISTKSKIAYLTQPVDLNIFWQIPVISYCYPKNGVIKKQIKINSKTPEELAIVKEKLQNESMVDQHIMSHIDNPDGRIKFKDIRKITIGISTKDIMSYRSKKKQAFYNCFVMILRIKIDDKFREFHVKVFNTGKLEMPGVQSDKMFQILLNYIVEILQPFYTNTLTYSENSDTVLINSNFNCGFYINREVLYDILRTKYNIQAIYDPCSYPGIQCKFYYNNDIGIQSGIQITTENKDKYKNITEVSFMIFRTGSVLIVGMCEEYVLQDIYAFLKSLLKTEFKHICQKLITATDLANKEKKKKTRRKTIHIVTGITDVNDTTNDVSNDASNDTANDTSNDITITVVKKQRKPRKSKKIALLEIV
jgi:hypothetical protein